MLYAKLDKPAGLPLSFLNPHRWVVERSTWSSMQRDETQGRRWLSKRPGGGNHFKYQGHWKWDSANQSYYFCIALCPQLTTVKITARQTTSIWWVYVWMISLLHMLPPKQKGKTKNVPFHIRHRTKLTPLTYSRQKWVLSWLLFLSLSHVYILQGLRHIIYDRRLHCCTK